MQYAKKPKTRNVFVCARNKTVALFSVRHLPVTEFDSSKCISTVIDNIKFFTFDPLKITTISIVAYIF